MNIIIFTRRRGNATQIDLKSPSVVVGVALAVIAVLATVFYAGFVTAIQSGMLQPDEQILVWNAELARQQEEIDRAQHVARENLDALAKRIGQMNSHIIRLDALGRRLTNMADLDDGEFDFANPPAQGGPPPNSAVPASGTELTAMLDGLARQVSDRERQLGILENLMLNRNLSEQVYPEGRPVKSGWISSYFGKRTDPFTGRPAMHKGLDFAGREGSEVVAVAAGVVIWSGERYGFGRLVEINHGNGYVTRYAHNRDNLVAVGEAVKKGHIIARMGATGRATGPNLHFEVLHHGKVVNPLRYIPNSN